MYVSVRVSEQSFNLYFHAYLLTWFVHSSIWNLCLWHISLCAFFLYSLSQYFTLFACLSMTSFLSFVLVITFLFLSFFMCVCLWYPFPFCYYLSVCWLAHVLLLSSTVKPPSCPMKMSNFRNHFSPANSFVVSEANFDLFQLFQSVRHK